MAKRSEGAGFLLAQVGAHASARFADRLGPMGLVPAQAGLLRAIAEASGGSQQEVAAKLGMFPSRLVALIDELEAHKLVERRPNPDDRRTHALRLTPDGHHALDAIGRIAREHQEALLAALTKDERETLTALLLRIADQQGLTRGVHPGYARMRAEK